VRGFRSESFGVYFDATKSTSGQRFFENLCRCLEDEVLPPPDRPSAMLYNVSAPISAILKSKLAGQRVVLRIDGLYFDRLSPNFIAAFSWPLRMIFSLGLRYPALHDVLAHLANLLNHNYTAFARILLADFVIYQSRFSQVVHQRYFRSKPFEIIVNGAAFRNEGRPPPSSDGRIRIVAIYDDWKPAKRITELVEFARWANESGRAEVHLTVLGYNGKLPRGAPAELKRVLEQSTYVRTLPRFIAFDGEFREALLQQDLHVTFTYRDPCPNTMIESMAHGLPVVAFESGGVPDIVGDAGVLLPADDFADGFFANHRFDWRFPSVDFDSVLAAIRAVVADLPVYRRRVQQRFADDLGIDVVAARYAEVLRRVARRD
jgi:glycosyltransferase involved in cell wall biosynthesis